MEEKKKLSVITSKEFNLDLDEIFQFGEEVFGLKQATIYEHHVWHLVNSLSTNYHLFPECRHLPTKSKMYRWVILDAHLIIYRITNQEIQVLRILHGKRSITKIRASRRIKPI
jgi:toxin ParE1/3/4